ncbi:expressed unknown protein [Seminavis robusta]|uniref:Uncharacterized protein n=1 Tax=Seminavis robusta TaxID=568900 RepID=A0A9N8EZ44_9STRA|nr:expressed unknown protein [Seminavis robusta]|eukprot:Sro3026_g342360.1 n/a (237) ;mRNA; r:5018-5728
MFFRKTKSLNSSALESLPKDLYASKNTHGDDDEEVKRSSIDSLVLRRLQGDAMAKWNNSPQQQDDDDMDDASCHSTSSTGSPRRRRRNVSDARRNRGGQRSSSVRSRRTTGGNGSSRGTRTSGINSGSSRANRTTGGNTGAGTPSSRPRRMRRVKSDDGAENVYHRDHERRQRRTNLLDQHPLPQDEEPRSLSPRPVATRKAVSSSPRTKSANSRERSMSSSSPPARRNRVMSHAA